MARKVFVSYKYADELVADLKKRTLGFEGENIIFVPRKTKARDYVDLLQDKIGKDHINLGEKDGESLVDFSDGSIETSLKSKIRQSSVTIVLISKGMKTSDNENDQWIPWEVSYSLRTVPTGGYTKQMNAILGIVLPDETGTYDWYYRNNYTSKLFKLLKDNTFNLKEKKYRECNGIKIHITSEPSFFKTVKWSDFMHGTMYNSYIETAINIKNNKGQYDFHINLD